MAGKSWLRAKWQARSREAQQKLKSRIGTVVLIGGIGIVSILFEDQLWQWLDAPAASTEAAVTIITPVPVASATAIPIQDMTAVTVWISPSGSKYHKTDTCSGMQSAEEKQLSVVLTEGYSPCKRCDPPQES